MAVLLAMAWRNLWRHWTRSLLTALAMALGIALCMAIISLYDGMFGTLRELMVDRMVGHVQIHHPDWLARRGLYDTIPHADDVLVAIEALPSSRGAVARVHGTALLGGDGPAAGVQLIGVDPTVEARFTRLAEVVPTQLKSGGPAGRFLDDAPAHQIVLGEDLARDLEVGVGDQVVAVTQDAYGSIGNDAYEVVGLFRSGDTSMDRSGAYLHLTDLQALLALDDQVHEIRVMASSDEPGPVQGLIADLEHTVPPLVELDGGGAPDIQPWWVINPMAAQMFDMRFAGQGMVLIVVFSLAGLGVVNTMLMSVLERTRELGVIRALGLGPWGIVLLIVLESAALAVLAAAAGLVIGLGLDAYLIFVGIDMSIREGEGLAMGGFSLPPVMYGGLSVEGIVQPLVGAFFFAVIAALLPAWRAASLQPVDAIRGE